MAALFQSMDLVARQPVGGQAIIVFGPEILIGDSMPHHRIRSDQDTVSHSQGHLVPASVPEQPRVWSPEIGAVGTDGSPAAP
jgi:hypothetical protein